MARGINKVIVLGNLGNDPEVRTTTSGSTVARISVATSESWTDKSTGQKQERTEWHRVVFFNRLAEVVNDYLKKGSQVYVEGSLRTNKWQDKDGQDKYTTEIIASEMQMLGGKGGGGGDFQSTAPMDPQRAPAPSQAASPKPAPAQAPTGGGPDINFDDDIPF